MASMQPRDKTNPRGPWKVRWRVGGKHRSQECVNRAAAKKVKAMVELHGDLPDHLTRTDLRDAPTFVEWTETYLSQLTGVSDRTRDDYKRQAARHMAALADLPLPAVTRPAVSRWVLDRKDHVSGKTLKNLHGLLHGILEAAMIEGHLEHNPAKGVRLPRVDDHQVEDMQFLTPDEFWQIGDEMPEDWRWVFILLVGTGLRLGEAMALNVGDIDLAGPTPMLRVNKALRYTRGEGYAIGPTKTKRSRRTVALPEDVVDAVRPHLDRPSNARLIVQPNGKAVYPTNLYARVWRPAVEGARRCEAHKKADEPCGCPGTLRKKPRIHDLRHTHVSWLIAQQMPLPLIQARLGHEQITTTVDRYGHLLPDLHAQAAAATQRAFGGPRMLES